MCGFSRLSPPRALRLRELHPGGVERHRGVVTNDSDLWLLGLLVVL